MDCRRRRCWDSTASPPLPAFTSRGWSGWAPISWKATSATTSLIRAMFTGIITDVGRVQAVVPDGDTRFEIETKYDTGSIALGSSIACAGPCLTVTETGQNWFAVSVSTETLS